MNDDDYIKKNRDLWNSRTKVHLESDFYDMPSFLAGKSSLKEIETSLLPDVKGKKILHLQCHFGQDSISLSKLGAKVTGVDLSDTSIEQAKVLAKKMGSDAEFICCDLYSLRENLDDKFDLVFTTYGTIGWLPDIDKWANIVSYYLKAGGQFIFVDFHPFIWTFDDNFEKIAYNYFNAEPIIETITGTYANPGALIKQESIGWNHPLSEVMQGLKDNHLRIDSFQEYDYSPYNCFSNTIEFEPGKFRISHFENKMPMVYSLLATKL